MEDEPQRKVILEIQPRPVFSDMPLPQKQRAEMWLPKQQREYDEFIKRGWREVTE